MRRSGTTLLALVLLAALLPAGSAVAVPADRAAAVAPAKTITPFTANLTETLAPGVVHRVGDWTTSNGDQAVQLIDVDPQADGIGIEASVPASGVHSLQTVGAQAACTLAALNWKRSSAVVGISTARPSAALTKWRLQG